MKVKLINVADYDIKEGKVSEVPFSTFVNLCGNIGLESDEPELPRMRLFKTMSEFITSSNKDIATYDENKPIMILQNGQFMVYLKEDNKEVNVGKNAAADTEENKGE